ncbi:MAG: hypothetical protein IE918_08200 [Campylobacterales bacterium]|jgi:hypothetical protein|uniref:hypothetical protein n=1 Tax=Sulfurovum sp. TaxID=1969726 RepID=UPI0019AB7F40|nr:hypothetical protein [Sulfurovum sp.]MBD3792110.1 hypothetical protein [Campylobacterales bacterium]MDD2450641.1 hypothetical protein [Sulfurovum sp.]MDD3499155.1 hypothetical protein [Sulfurovum sp.]MDY0402804.1 hypothetical protein [Sulfurovum sp.]
MRKVVEKQTLVEPVEFKTITADFVLDIGSLSQCDICEQNGKLYAYVEELNIYLPVRKSKVA